MNEKEIKQRMIEEIQQRIATLEKEQAEAAEQAVEVESTQPVAYGAKHASAEVVEDDDDFDAMMAEGVNLSSGAPDAATETEQKDTTADGTNAEGEIQVDVKKLNAKEIAVNAKNAYMNNKVRKHILKNNKRILKEFAAVAAIMLVFALVGSKFVALYPYAFTVDGKVICYVDGDKQAEKVMDKLLEDYKVEGTEVRAVDTDGMFKVEKSDDIKVADEKVLGVEEAVEAINEAAVAATEEGKEFNVTLACTKTEVQPYTPDPNYEQDDTMLAGQAEVIVEGVDGEQKVSTTYVTTNGEVTSENVTATEILDEGSKATIKKGTLGLPEGEDWQTYEGLPVFNDGADLVVTSQKYLGAPYKYGGYSLTNGIDCVQFVRALYKMYGITLPNNHPGIRSSGVGVSLSDAQAGDIVCYAPHHMGIYMGDGKVIHATHQGVRITDVHYSSKKIVTIRRIAK